MQTQNITPFLEFELPWPNKRLSPNARVHWSVLASAKSKYKSDVQLIAMNALIMTGLAQKPDFKDACIEYIFCPPRAFEYDLDNALARMKAATDGLSLAFGCDDKGWQFMMKKGDPAKPKGRVIVRVYI